MKKFFALCSMIVALGFVAGCPGGDSSTPATTPATENAPATDGASETTPAVAETPAE